jgi:hypothetical protein
LLQQRWNPAELLAADDFPPVRIILALKPKVFDGVKLGVKKVDAYHVLLRFNVAAQHTVDPIRPRAPNGENLIPGLNFAEIIVVHVRILTLIVRQLPLCCLIMG